MKFSPRFWLAATAVVVLSLAPKIALDVLRDHVASVSEPNEKLRAFLATASDGPVMPIRQNAPPDNVVGWRFAYGGCVTSAYLSSSPGVFDYWARAYAPGGARMAYSYRGTITDRPPTRRLAIDVIAFRLSSEFTPSRASEPRYVVLVYPAPCPAALTLAWSAFSLD